MSDKRIATWDEMFLEMTRAASMRGNCTRAQVGSIIVDANRRLLSMGYNGSAAGEPGCLTEGACERGKLTYKQLAGLTGDYDNCISIHAEANAIMYADVIRRQGGTIYSTYKPCAGCFKLIKGSGLKRIVWTEGELVL